MFEIVDMDGNPVRDGRFLTFREAEERFSEIPEEEAGRLFLSGGEMDGAAERGERGFYFIVVDFGDGARGRVRFPRHPQALPYRRGPRPSPGPKASRTRMHVVFWVGGPRRFDRFRNTNDSPKSESHAISAGPKTARKAAFP